MFRDDEQKSTRVEAPPSGGLSGTAPTTARQRWLARAAYLLWLAALVVLLVAGLLRDLLALACGVLGIAIMLAALWWFLSSRGVLRWLAAGLAIAAPLAVVVLYVGRHLLWEIVVVVLLAAAGIACARTALAGADRPAGMPEKPAAPARHPFLIMNPRSGGGKVGKFGLDEKAIALGAQVALLDGPGPVDVEALARRAVADGADLLGVAGGDGTQALVAGVAAEHGLPFLVVSAGTRNHFAMDLGLDRDHPDLGLDALTDGVEVSLDLGRINGRVFVNNASFGAYADVVQSPAYRDDKLGTTLQALPDLLGEHSGPRLRVRIDGEEVIDGPTALLVSNSPYGTGDLAGLGHRPRIDTGRLGVVAVTVRSAAQAAALVAGQRSSGLRTFAAHEVVIESDAPHIPVGVDGEALLLATPVRCTVQPGALRVWLPRNRPGIPQPRPPLDRAQLRREALTVMRMARPAP